MSEYLGFFLFLGILLMAFWLLIFLVGFLGYWSLLAALNSVMPSLFKKKEEEISRELEG